MWKDHKCDILYKKQQHNQNKPKHKTKTKNNKTKTKPNPKQRNKKIPWPKNNQEGKYWQGKLSSVAVKENHVPDVRLWCCGTSFTGGTPKEQNIDDKLIFSFRPKYLNKFK